MVKKLMKMMINKRDEDKTKDELLKELQELRQEYETLQLKYKQEIDNNSKEISSLIESEKKYRSIFQNLQIGLIRTQIDSGNVIDANDTVAQFFGYPDRESFLRNSVNTLNVYADISARERIIKLLQSEGEFKNQELQIIEKDGTYSWIQISGKLDKENGIIDTQTEDITQRKLAEIALKESEERFRSIFENTAIGLYRTTLDGRIIMANPAIVKLMGYDSFEDLAKLNLEDKDYSEFSLRKFFIQRMEEDGEIKGLEFSWKRRDGKTIYVRESAKAIRNEDGTINYFEGTIEDITEKKQMEENLRNSEELFRKLVLTVPDLIVKTDINGNIAFFNETAISSFPYIKLDNIFNRNILSFIAENDRQRAVDYTKLMFEKKLGVQEYQLIFDDGSVTDCEVNGDVIRDTNGSPTGMVYVIRNISSRKSIEKSLLESKERFRNLMDLLPQTVFETNIEGTVTFVNQMAYKQFGYTPEDVKNGLNCFNLFLPEEQNKAFKNFTTTLKKSESSMNEYNMVRKDGSTFPVLIFSNSITKNGNPQGLRGIIIDISEIKKAQEKISMMNEELEFKVAERTFELNEAIHIIEESNVELKMLNDSIAKEAEKLLSLNEKLSISEHELKIANQTKDKFFSIIAHDLRNPIGSFRNILEMLKLYYERMSSDEIYKMINTLHDASEKTFELLENLLQWSQFQTNRIQFSPMHSVLFYNVEKCLQLVQQSAKEKGIELLQNVPINLMAYYDSNFVNAILRNLMTNAIKFTAQGGKVTIGASNTIQSISEKRNKYEVTVFVRDNGIGMNQEKIDNLFRLEYNVSSSGTANEHGSGLGLILCKEFVEKQGGRIWVESEVGIGSTFYFTLPAKP